MAQNLEFVGGLVLRLYFERQIKKVEYEANVRYNRQMMSQEEDASEFWHYRQDLERENEINICVNHGGHYSEDELQDDYELRILGTYDAMEGRFSKTFYIVEVLEGDARGRHETSFRVGEMLACSYSNSPRISRNCDYFADASDKFFISGRMGVITYGENRHAKDVSYEMRLIDQVKPN